MAVLAAVPEAAGSVAAGPGAAGPGAAGPEAAGPEAAVPKAAGPETTVPKAAGPKTTVPKAAGPKTTVPKALGLMAAVQEALDPAAAAPEALSASNEQIVQFGGRLASVSDVLTDTSSDLGAGLDNLDTALANVKWFIEGSGTELTEGVCRLADVTQILLDKQPEIERVLYSAPKAGPAAAVQEALGRVEVGPETLGPEALGPQTLGPQTLGPQTLGPEAGPAEATGLLAVPEPQPRARRGIRFELGGNRSCA
ncbi:hypothetical protein [Nocardia sp. XZ_19_385]|uniref:hypothetical protein n=1 Tax=Nocardia sp. XZ_19_385 TaxID=2769488 RepID=UPI001E48EB73|nr:hypothetical protein [Nocardia sp. XZ_19_385]